MNKISITNGCFDFLDTTKLKFLSMAILYGKSKIIYKNQWNFHKIINISGPPKVNRLRGIGKSNKNTNFVEF